jgi:hypothetical protein
MFVDAELDQVAYFGCTDAGVVQVSNMSAFPGGDGCE